MYFLRVLSTGLLIVLLLALAGVVSPTHNTGPYPLITELAQVPGLTLDQYSVAGSTAKEIRAELDWLGPKDPSGAPRDAYTEWKVSWRWPDGERGPDFSRTQVERKVRITLPRWEGVQYASPGLRAQWNDYMTALVTHERNHLELVDSGYQEIPQKISDAYKANPELSIAEAHQLAGEVLAKIRAADREYDLSTQHGRSEGVKFPG